jgi:peptide subunit release factor 1 (eRF1)
MVRKLVVNDDLDKKGYVCKEHHYLSLKPGNCPFCQNELFSAENIADELVEISRLHGVDITIVEYRQELLKKYDGVAAVVYSMVSAV